ncbi:MAG: hypothetical protein EOP51_15180 [Sphingobacteriales bacterium]|nr:MAG: hypothetical protein EOP51_15180 [Sphingobacteriales bacterium]
MNIADAIGGPWAFRIKLPAEVGAVGFDIYVAENTFSDQPTEQFMCRIIADELYVGRMNDGTVYITRVNWYNTGAHYRSCAANFPDFPNVAIVNYFNLQRLNRHISEFNVGADGAVDIMPFIELMGNDAIRNSTESENDSLLAILSALAHTTERRELVARNLWAEMDSLSTEIFMRYGVLLFKKSGSDFTRLDKITIASVLEIMPAPIVNKIHLVGYDEGLRTYGNAGSYGDGGRIYMFGHTTGVPLIFRETVDGQVYQYADGVAKIFIHEIGHLVDNTTVSYGTDTYTTLYNEGGSDTSAYFLSRYDPLRTEEFINIWVKYFVNSETTIDIVRRRRNGVLSQKLAYVLSLLPNLEIDKVPTYYVNPESSEFNTSLASVERSVPAYLGHAGTIHAVSSNRFLYES